jgi:hypothetical protein
MAYSSFRLRRADLIASPDTNPFGSYVRGDDLTAPVSLVRDTNDSALRAEAFVQVSADLTTTVEFSATATDYDSILLNWTEFALTNVNDISVGETKPFEVLIVYSPTGFPETVADGIVIKTQKYFDTDYLFEHTNLPASSVGNWAYYSLFIHWNQNGTGVTGVNWYERMTTLQELLPKDYGSYDQLWNRIPAQYRVGDTSGANLDPSGLGRGQLSRFLSIFSFELDKTRTLIDKVMTQYDPSVNESQSIDALADMFALEVTSKEIGTSRLRQILQDIGYYRQQKGTISSIKQYITALSGCQVDVIESSVSPRYTFRVYAEKANLVADSLFVVTSGTKKWEFSSSSASCTFTKSGENLIVTNTDSASVQFALTSLVEVPVAADVEYWSSAKVVGDGIIHGAQWSASASWTTWNTESQLEESGISEELTPSSRLVIKMPVLATTTTRYPVMIFSLQPGESTTVSQWMVEPGKYGEFFNGSSDFGGFVYQDNFSDHAWSGSTYASYSVYSTNKKKVNNAITRLLPQLIPVTMLLDTNIDYTIQFDWIPGKT